MTGKVKEPHPTPSEASAKGADLVFHGAFCQVFAFDDRKAYVAQALFHGTGIVEGILQRGLRVAAITNHQRQPCFGRRCDWAVWRRLRPGGASTAGGSIRPTRHMLLGGWCHRPPGA